MAVSVNSILSQLFNRAYLVTNLVVNALEHLIISMQVSIAGTPTFGAGTPHKGTILFVDALEHYILMQLYGEHQVLGLEEDHIQAQPGLWMPWKTTLQ